MGLYFSKEPNGGVSLCDRRYYFRGGRLGSSKTGRVPQPLVLLANQREIFSPLHVCHLITGFEIKDLFP